MSISITQGPYIYSEYTRDRSPLVGQSFYLEVFATGSDPLTYEWFKNDTFIATTTTNRYTVSSASHSDAGIYKVRVSLQSTPSIFADSNMIKVRVFTNVIPDTDPNGINISRGTRYFAFGFNSGPILYGDKSYVSVTARTNNGLTGDTFTEEQLVSLYEFNTQTNVLFDENRISQIFGGYMLNSDPSFPYGISFSDGQKGEYENFVFNLKADTNYIFVMKTTANDSYEDVALSFEIGNNTSLPITYYGTQLALDPNGVTLSIPLVELANLVSSIPTITLGNSFTLTVTASGTAGFGFVYQWFKNGVSIPDAISTTYTVSSATTNDTGSYYVRVSYAGYQNNPTFYKDSNTIVMRAPVFTSVVPEIDQYGAGLLVDQSTPGQYFALGFNTGSTTSAHIYAITNPYTNAEELIVSLYKLNESTNLLIDAGRVTDLNSASYTGSSIIFFPYLEDGSIRNAIINNLSSNTTYILVTKTIWNDSVSYDDVRLSVESPNGAAMPLTYYKYQPALETNGVTLDLRTVITAQPVATSVSAGESFSLSVTAKGANGVPLSYQWFKGGVAIGGATNATYTVSSATTDSAGSYYVRVSYVGYETDAAFYRDSNTVVVVVVLRTPAFTNVVPDVDPFGRPINTGNYTRYFGYSFNTGSATSVNIYAKSDQFAGGPSYFDEQLVSLYKIYGSSNLLFESGRIINLVSATLDSNPASNTYGLWFSSNLQGNTRNAVINNLEQNTSYAFVLKTTFNDPIPDVELSFEAPTGIPLIYFSTQLGLTTDGFTISPLVIPIVSVTEKPNTYNSTTGKVTMVFSFTPLSGALTYKLLSSDNPANVLAASSGSPFEYEATAFTPLSYYIAAYDSNGNRLTAYQDPTPTTNVPCLPHGTRVLTPSGYRLVEDFADGDLVVTEDGREVPVKVHRSSTTCSDAKSAPVRIAAQSFFGAYPVAPIRVSPWHAFKVGSGNAWMLPKDVIGVDGVIQEPFGHAVEYYHFELSDYLRDNLVLDGGAVVESYGIPWKQAAGLWGKATYVMDQDAGYCRRITVCV